MWGRGGGLKRVRLLVVTDQGHPSMGHRCGIYVCLQGSVPQPTPGSHKEDRGELWENNLWCCAARGKQGCLISSVEQMFKLQGEEEPICHLRTLEGNHFWRKHSNKTKQNKTAEFCAVRGPFQVKEKERRTQMNTEVRDPFLTNVEEFSAERYHNSQKGGWAKTTECWKWKNMKI